jgi:hypothetical protein
MLPTQAPTVDTVQEPEWPDRHIVGPDSEPVPFHRGQDLTWDSVRRIVAMYAGSQGGKALAIDTPIPTPDGFVDMGDLQVGDAVFDEHGKICQVTLVTPIRNDRKCYRLIFDDGSTLVADADHRWRTQTYKQRKNEYRRVKNPNPKWTSRPQCQAQPNHSVVTTEEICGSLVRKHGGTNHSIELCGAVQYPERDLLIPPYSLGCWLGDGSSAKAELYCADAGIVDEIRNEGVSVSDGKKVKQQGEALTYKLDARVARRNSNTGRYEADGSFLSRLGEMGLVGNKHIPEVYLIASAGQRLALLQGLMDTDGYCRENGSCEFTTTRSSLADGFLALARSLGIKARMAEGRATYQGKDCGPKFRITFSSNTKVFRLRRKRGRQQNTCRPDVQRRYITNVVSVESVPVRCIQVDSPSSLYLAGASFIPTHNTAFGPWWLWREAMETGGGDHLAVTASYDLFKLKLLPTLLEVFEHILRIGRYWAGDRVLELADPDTGQFWANRSMDRMWGRIILRSADSLGGLESATARSAWLDEAGQDRFTLYAYRAIRRRLALYRGRILITTTLYNLGWVVQQIMDPAEKTGAVSVEQIGHGELEYTDSEEADTALIQFDSIINPTYPLEEYEEARAIRRSAGDDAR